MTFNITPFKSTDDFTMAGFNGKIADINSGIGAYANEYWWKRRVNITLGGYVEKKTVVSGDVYIYNSSSQSSVSVTYSSNITVTLSGEISFNSPQTTTRDYVATHLSEFLGKYVKNLIQSTSTVYFISPNAEYYETEEGTPMVNRYTSGVYSVTSEYVSTPTIGDWEYLHSPNRSAYPDSGIQDGYEYEYLGIPFDNAVNGVKIETGSYVGTGEYGANSPNTLTFGFEPKILAIFYSNGTIAHNSTSDEDRPAIGYVSSLTAEYSQGLFFAYNSNPSQDAMYAKKSGNTIWWYALSDATTQFNSNTTYYYVAIG